MLKIHTHYTNLKVSNNASVAEIRAAYKVLMQQYHPDKFDGDPENAIRIVKIIQTSYAVLSNPHKRARHDNWIDNQKKEEKRKSTKSDTTSEYFLKPACNQRDKHNFEQNNLAEATRFGLNIIILGFILVALILAFVSVRKASLSNKAPPLHLPSNKNDSKIEFVYVKSGCFQMGGDGFYKNEKPMHQVCLKGYYMGKYEVTQTQWQHVMSKNPSQFRGNNRPVEKVSWDNVQTFIIRLNQKSGKQYRLPTEAEWEFACRSGRNGQEYCGSNKINKVAWYKGNSANKTHPVGKKNPNKLGFYDMSGNVMEWTQDRYQSDYYRNSPIHNPKGPLSGSEYVIRGGSWMDNQWLARTSQRQGKNSNFNSQGIGFRLASSPYSLGDNKLDNPEEYPSFSSMFNQGGNNMDYSSRSKAIRRRVDYLRSPESGYSVNTQKKQTEDRSTKLNTLSGFAGLNII